MSKPEFLMPGTDLPEPPPDLHAKVIERVRQYKRRVLIAKTAGFGVLFAASSMMLAVAYFNLVSAFVHSGFFEFTSLFFSDFGAAMANFQDFAFSILESFPVFSAAFLLAGIIAVIWSAVHFFGDIAAMRAQGNLAIS
jgi:hypothetical protein